MLFKKLTLFSYSIIVVLCANAQMHTNHREEPLTDINGATELNITLGANNLLGDLGGNLGIGQNGLKDYMWKTMRPLGGIGLTKYKTSWLGINAGLNISAVTGVDSFINNQGGLERWRYYRNLSFKSSIIEGYIKADIYPLMIINKYAEIYQVSPFVTAGVGFFHFNPKANLNGTWVPLQPLHTEGQGFAEYPERKPYALTQIYIPLSLGVKYYFNNHWALSGGMNMRVTFTDYIDDASTTYIDPTLFYKYLPADQAAIAKQLYERSRTPEKVKPGIDRAHSNNKDSYLTFFLTLSLRLGQGVRFYYGGM